MVDLEMESFSIFHDPNKNGLEYIFKQSSNKDFSHDLIESNLL